MMSRFNEKSRKLGQHFLINKDKLKKIVDVLEINSGDTIIEIGPGHGELTFEINKKFPKSKIIAVEKDKILADSLELKINSERIKNIKIVNGDILKIIPELPKSYILDSESYKLVGNIPYYITGHLLRIIEELKTKPSSIVLTVQKEVAERIIAVPPKMNLLSASVGIWADSKIIDLISKKDFSPPPKVDSAIIKIIPKSHSLDFDSSYYEFIKILFKQPRKTILNNLKNFYKNPDLEEKIKLTGIEPTNRPQNLNIDQILKLKSLF